jgi:hypothetical protein
MPGRLSSLFAGREIGGVSLKTAALVVVGAFVAGFLVAWLTTFVPGWVRGPEASPEPSPSVSYSGDVIVPTLEPVLRELDEQDALAGVTTVRYTYQGTGTFTIMPGKEEPLEGGAPVRWVSIAIEDGIEVDAEAFKAFVFSVLEDNRSWGSEGRLQFVQTDGVADYRIVLASPFTSAATCPNPHTAVRVGPVTEASPSVETTASPSVPVAPGLAAGDVSEPQTTCAEQGIVPISLFEWTAGFDAFAGDRTAARQYIVNHQLGHLFGHEETACVSGRALVMDDQRVALPDCEANPWPFPDATVPGMPGITPTVSPS